MIFYYFSHVKLTIHLVVKPRNENIAQIGRHIRIQHLKDHLYTKFCEAGTKTV
jgi:hypothetical protein